MPQQDSDYKKKSDSALFKQSLDLPLNDPASPLYPIVGGLGGGIGTSVARAGSSILKGILKKIIPSPKAIKTATTRPAPGSGLARIQRDFASLPSARATAPMYRVTGMTVTKAAKDSFAAERSEMARRAAMRSRVQTLARNAEERASTSIGMRSRVQSLARQAELDMKASLAKKKAEIIKGQNSQTAAGKGPESVGYRDAPLPGSAAAIPRGGNVPTLGGVGAQIPTRSSFYKRRK